MKNVKLVALRRHPYAVGFREPDEPYEATQVDAEVLVKLGWAKLAGADAKPVEKVTEAVEAKQTYRTRDLKSKG